MSGKHFANLAFAGVMHATEKVRARHKYPRRTETTLQRVVAAKRGLKCGQLRIGWCETLGRSNFATFGGNGERKAGTLGDAVYGDRTCSANAVFATHVNAGRTESVTQKIRKQSARFALARALDSVQAKCNRMQCVR